MFDNEKSNSIGRSAVLAGLWAINILILIFGLPFLLFNKIKGLFTKPAGKIQPETSEKSKSARYFPCRN